MADKPKETTSKRKPAALGKNEPPVYFLSLAVDRVLCFKDKQVFDLTDSNNNPAQWTVILGDNGVGKTTLLRCLAGMELTIDIIDDEEDEEEMFVPLLFHGAGSPSMWQELGVFGDKAHLIYAQVAYHSSLLLKGRREEW